MFYIYRVVYGDFTCKPRLVETCTTDLEADIAVYNGFNNSSGRDYYFISEYDLDEFVEE